MKPFLPKPGWVVLVLEIGVFSAQSDAGRVGEVVEAHASTAFPGWLAVTLDCEGRPWVCEQARCQLASARRVA
jgi:hypothetical protein